MEYEIISTKDVEDKVIIVRGQKVLLDRDVAALYGVETKRVNEAVRNNIEKFPDGYVLELTDEESSSVRSKISTIQEMHNGKHSKYNYKAFTERGLYMLATILKSPPIRTSHATVSSWTRLVSLSTGVAKYAPVNRFITIGHNGLSKRCSEASIAIRVRVPCLSRNLSNTSRRKERQILMLHRARN